MTFAIIWFQLKDVRHENVNLFVGFYDDQHVPAIVTDFCSRGSLEVRYYLFDITKIIGIIILINIGLKQVINILLDFYFYKWYFWFFVCFIFVMCNLAITPSKNWIVLHTTSCRLQKGKNNTNLPKLTFCFFCVACYFAYVWKQCPLSFYFNFAVEYPNQIHCGHVVFNEKIRTKQTQLFLSSRAVNKRTTAGQLLRLIFSKILFCAGRYC
jgi:hypothetical protein